MNSNTHTVTLIAGGDILIKENLLNTFFEKEKSCIFSEIKSYVNSADIAFANLETPLLIHGERNPEKDSALPFLKTDPRIAEAIQDAGFNVICLANNHTMDYGREGLAQTISALKKHNIKYLGAGMSIMEARRPLYLEKKGLKFTFLAYSIASPAGKKEPGCSPLRASYIVEDIKKNRRGSDFIIVSLHQGIEYSDYPVPEHRKLAQSLIDNGASIVLGHHPHVLQGAEFYKNGIIIHSMGNIIFDQTKEEDDERLSNSYLAQKGGFKFSSGDKRLREAMLFKFDFNGAKNINMELIPLIQNNRDIPRIAYGDRAGQILERYGNISKGLLDSNHEIWSLLEKLHACENVEDFKLGTIFKRIHRIRLRHFNYLKKYIMSKNVFKNI